MRCGICRVNEAGGLFAEVFITTHNGAVFEDDAEGAAVGAGEAVHVGSGIGFHHDAGVDDGSCAHAVVFLGDDVDPAHFVDALAVGHEEDDVGAGIGFEGHEEAGAPVGAAVGGHLGDVFAAVVDVEDRGLEKGEAGDAGAFPVFWCDGPTVFFEGGTFGGIDDVVGPGEV